MIRKLSTSSVLIPLLFILPAAASAQTTNAAPPPPPPEAAPPPPPAPAPEAAPPPAPAPVYAPAPPPPPVVPPPPANHPSGVSVQLMPLKLMLQKGIISQAEYDSAAQDMAESVGTQLPNQEHLVIGKWASTLYGFVEADSIWDSTRSLNDSAGSSLIARAGTTAGDNSRVTFGARNSRLGLRIKAPEVAGVRASAMIESDFLGNQPTVADDVGTGAPSPNPYTSEGSFFTSPTFRIRHMMVKVETPVVDVMFGQYWQLFGWQGAYQANTVEIQGVVGEVYGRTPQIRISKTVKANPVTFEVAIAAMRPFQRDSGTPDGQGGLRLAIDSWTGMQTVGAAGTQISPMSVAVTGMIRHVAVNSIGNPSAGVAASGSTTNDLTMGAIAADAFLPVIPGTKDKKGNSLSFNGEFSTGYGDADQFTGLTGGIGFATPSATAPTNFDIDPGVVTYDYQGKLHGIQWTTYLVGVQYYFPGCDGKFWISGNYSREQSANMHDYAVGGSLGSKTSLMHAANWWDANVFVDPVPGFRLGLEYANTKTTYVDGDFAINHRVQLSGFFLF